MVSIDSKVCLQCLSSLCGSNAVYLCTKGTGSSILVEGGQEFRDIKVATGIRTVTTGLQICFGKRAASLNNEIGPHCDHPLNVLVIREMAILDGGLDLIKCLLAGSVECETNVRLEMSIRSRKLQHSG